MTSTESCCGQPPDAACRCRTYAAALADAVRAFVGHRVSHRQDAEDITQETLIRLYAGVDTLRDAGALEGWTYQIARNAIVDHYRRSGTRPVPIPPDQTVLLQQETPSDQDAPGQMLAECLPPLLARVPATYRQALELTDIGGMTQDQAAKELGLSTSGMKSRVQRGRRLLRAEVTRCCEVAVNTRGAVLDAAIRDPEGTC